MMFSSHQFASPNLQIKYFYMIPDICEDLKITFYEE